MGLATIAGTTTTTINYHHPHTLTIEQEGGGGHHGGDEGGVGDCAANGLVTLTPPQRGKEQAGGDNLGIG